MGLTSLSLSIKVFELVGGGGGGGDFCACYLKKFSIMFVTSSLTT